MNKIKKQILTFVIAVVVLSLMAACGSEKGEDNVSDSSSEITKVYAATSANPKPFEYVDENNELVGHNIELLKAVFDKLPQYELVIETTDFTSIFAGIDSDRYQMGVNNLAMNEERKEKYLFSDPIFENQYVALVASDSDLSSLESLSELAGKSYIGNTGVNVTTTVESYNEQNSDNQIEINYTEADLVVQLQDIESGKYDFTLMDKPMYEYYNAEYNFDLKVLELSEELSSGVMAEPYSYFIISKGNEQLLEDVNNALKEVIEDGTSKEINEKYFGEDYTPNS